MQTGTTAELRQQVVDAYGGACVQCGEHDPDLLHLDHMHNDGAKERKVFRGKRFYARLIRQNHPDRIQLLCVSCHTKKTRAAMEETGRRPRRPTAAVKHDIYELVEAYKLVESADRYAREQWHQELRAAWWERLCLAAAVVLVVAAGAGTWSLIRWLTS